MSHNLDMEGVVGSIPAAPTISPAEPLGFEKAAESEEKNEKAQVVQEWCSRLAHFPPGEPCASCAIRPGTDANQSPETMTMLKECIASGEPFFCHESTAVLDPDGFATDRHGNTYRRLPESRWRLCRGWTRARAPKSA